MWRDVSQLVDAVIRFGFQFAEQINRVFCLAPADRVDDERGHARGHARRVVMMSPDLSATCHPKRTAK